MRVIGMRARSLCDMQAADRAVLTVMNADRVIAMVSCKFYWSRLPLIANDATLLRADRWPFTHNAMRNHVDLGGDSALVELTCNPPCCAVADIKELCQHESSEHDPYCKNGGVLYAQGHTYDYSSCSRCECTDGWNGPDCSCTYPSGPLQALDHCSLAPAVTT